MSPSSNLGSPLRLPVIAGCLSMILLFASPVGAQSTIIDLDSPISHDIKTIVNQHCPSFPLADIEGITLKVQMVAADRSLEPGMLLALMVGEESYSAYPQARLYYFNLDMGSLAENAVFPVAWLDSERVARAYEAEYERYEDKTAAVAAYFVGSRTLPPSGDISALNQTMKDLVSSVLTLSAEWSHLGERRGPQIVEVQEETPPTSFETQEYDFTEIEQAYIRNMMHFNPRLDDETAKEIFEAIRVHASEYQTVDARLVMALVATESSFRPNAVSRSGAQGLGQLMPFTSDRFGVEDPFNVDENIRATFAYLAREIERWSGYNYPLDRILAAYNAGPGAVEQYTDPPHNGLPPYDETVNYVGKVVNRYFYFLPVEEREEKIRGQSRHYDELCSLASEDSAQ